MPFQTGNPGRPKGSKNRKLELLRSSDERLQKKILEMALSGDIAALKIIADRLWPRLRAQAVPVNVQTESSDLASQGSAIIAAVLNGMLPPDISKDLLSALSDQARLVEFSQIEERLRVLEDHREEPTWGPKQVEHELLPIRGRKRTAKK